MFVGLHAVVAMQTNIPEVAISDQEGRDFMKAAQNVMRHYSTKANQKTLDWIAFAGCGVGMYAPRFVAIRLRKQAEAAAYGNARPGGPGPASQVIDLDERRPPERRPGPFARRPPKTAPEAAPVADVVTSTYAPSVPAGPDHEED